MKTRFNQFINENLSDDDKLRIMYFVEDLDKELGEQNYEMSGSNINFDEKEMTISYNWYSPEEGGGDDWIISYEDGKIKVEHHNYGSSVMSDEPYDNKSIDTYETIDDFLYELKTSWFQ